MTTTRFEEIFIAGGCLWGVQEFIKHLPGVVSTQAGRANGRNPTTQGSYDGYAECVRTQFDAKIITVERLIDYLFEIIDPYSIDRQGQDVGKKYRTGIYSRNPVHLEKTMAYLSKRDDAERIAVEVLPLTNYVPSDDEHQDRLTLHPNDYCHIPLDLLHKYRNK
jgi:peptide-methionine (S)-S-oxide reductase